MKRLLSILLCLTLVLGMSISTDVSFAQATNVSSSVNSSGELTITGSTTYGQERAKVMVRSASGDLLHLEQIQSGSDKDFSLSVQLDDTVSSGDITVSVATTTGSADATVNYDSSSQGSDSGSGGSSGGGSSGGSSDSDKVKFSIKGPEGYILSTRSITFESGESVLDLTKRICDAYDIEFDPNRGYVSSIGGIAEKDYGENSGWTYYIDGEKPNIGAGMIDVEAGQRIQWIYTSDYTKDKDYDPNVSFNDMSSSSMLSYATNNLSENMSDSRRQSYEGLVIDTLSAMEEPEEVVSEDEGQEVNPALKLKEDKTKIDSVAKIASRLIETEDSVEDATQKAGFYLEQFKNTSKKLEGELRSYAEQKSALLLEALRTRAITEVTGSLDFKIKNDEGVVDFENSIASKIASLESDMSLIEPLYDKYAVTSSKQLKTGLILSVKNRTDQYSLEIPETSKQLLLEKGIEEVRLKTQQADIKLNKDILKESGKLQVKVSVDQLSNASGTHDVYSFKLKSGRDIKETFNAPIVVEIPYYDKYAQWPTAYYLKPDGTREIIGGEYIEDSKLFRFATNHFSDFYVDDTDITFEDIENHKYASDICAAVSKGIISGQSPEVFAPDATVTRAELASMLANVTKLRNTQKNTTFTDVNDGMWFSNAVEIASEYGFITGYPDGSFAPNATITREELAVILSKVLTHSGYSSYDISVLTAYADYAQTAPWALEGMSKVIEMGIFEGDAMNRIRPSAPATRAEVASLLNRLYAWLY